MRRTDHWLIGLVVFLVAIVLVACLIGFTGISRQQRATCYQLTSIEASIDRELALAHHEGNPAKREAHLDSAAGLRVYASGLRAIVPGCPRPPRSQHR